MAWVRRSITGLVVAVLAGPSALAHDFWVEPSEFRPDVGSEVSLSLMVGDDFAGEPLPYIDEWIVSFQVSGPDGDHPIKGFLGDDPAGRIAPVTPGIYVVGYRSNRTHAELEPERFQTYLQSRGLEPIIEHRAERGETESPGREYFSRCAKALLEVGAAEADPTFKRELGLTLELIPEQNPYVLSAGQSLSVRLVYEGEPLPEALIIAFTRDRPDEKQQIRTDAEGRSTVSLPRAGIWLVSAVHMIPVEADPKADWESFWASLTFELPAE